MNRRGLLAFLAASLGAFTLPRRRAQAESTADLKPGQFEWCCADGSFESLRCVVTIAPVDLYHMRDRRWFVLEYGNSPFEDRPETAMWIGHYSSVRVIEPGRAWVLNTDRIGDEEGTVATAPLAPGTIFIWNEPGPRYGTWGVVCDPVHENDLFPERTQAHLQAGNFDGLFAGVGGRIRMRSERDLR